MIVKRRAGLRPAQEMFSIVLVAIVYFAVFACIVGAIATPRGCDTVNEASHEQELECVRYNSKRIQIAKMLCEQHLVLGVLALDLPEVEDTASTQPPAETKTPLQLKVERMKSEYAVAGQVYEYLNGHGLSDVVIAGVLGNMMAECGGQTLNLDWDVYGHYGGYYGLCQWSLTYAPGVNGADVTGQLDYLMSNIRTNMEYFGGSFDDFCAITDAGSAARYFCNYYERGSGTSVRAANAVTALAWIQQE